MGGKGGGSLASHSSDLERMPPNCADAAAILLIDFVEIQPAAFRRADAVRTDGTLVCICGVSALDVEK
jgi:hypothetical protein